MLLLKLLLDHLMLGEIAEEDTSPFEIAFSKAEYFSNFFLETFGHCSRWHYLAVCFLGKHFVILLAPNSSFVFPKYINTIPDVFNSWREIILYISSITPIDEMSNVGAALRLPHDFLFHHNL